MQRLAVGVLGTIVVSCGWLVSDVDSSGRLMPHVDASTIRSLRHSVEVVIPQHCPPLVSMDSISLATPNFAGAVRSSGALTTLTVRRVEWVHDPMMTPSFGSLRIEGTEQGTDRPVTVRAASQCAEAAGHLDRFGPGSTVTVLTGREDWYPGLPSPGDPWVTTMWLDTDWNRFLLGLPPSDEFAREAADRSLDPFDLVRAVIASARSCVADAAARAACGVLHPLVPAAEWRDSSWSSRSKGESYRLGAEPATVVRWSSRR